MPSLYAGFRLPVIEAMAARTPAICSNTTNLPEIAADAAITCVTNAAEQPEAAMVPTMDPAVRTKWRKAEKHMPPILPSIGPFRNADGIINYSLSDAMISK